MTVSIHSTKAFHGFLSPRANAGLVQNSTLHFMLLTQPSPKLTSNYSPKYSLPNNIKMLSVFRVLRKTVKFSVRSNSESIFR